MSKVGDRIKKRRQELDMSVDEVADKLKEYNAKIDRSTIYRYESSEIEKFSITILEPLAKVLKTTPAYLMGWDESYADELIERAPYGKLPDELQALDLTPTDIKMIQTYLRAKKSDKAIVKNLVKTIDKLLKIDEPENE